MSKMFRRLFSLSLLFSLLLLLMVACGGDDDDNDEAPPPPPPAPEEPEKPPEEDPPEEDPPEEPAPAPPPPDENVKSIDDTCILWKPISESDHKLVVLLPTNYGNPDVFVIDDKGNMERGRYVGRTNGNRATYRFSRPGSNYSNPSYLKVGGTKYKVKSPEKRHSC